MAAIFPSRESRLSAGPFFFPFSSLFGGISYRRVRAVLSFLSPFSPRDKVRVFHGRRIYQYGSCSFPLISGWSREQRVIYPPPSFTQGVSHATFGNAAIFFSLRYDPERMPPVFTRIPFPPPIFRMSYFPSWNTSTLSSFFWDGLLIVKQLCPLSLSLVSTSLLGGCGDRLRFFPPPFFNIAPGCWVITNAQVATPPSFPFPSLFSPSEPQRQLEVSAANDHFLPFRCEK